MNIKDAVDEFLLAAAADRLREATLKWYKSILNRYAVYTGAETSICDVTTRDLCQYIADLRSRNAYAASPQRDELEQKVSDSTVAAHVRALHSFWAWVSDEYQIENPMKNIRRVRPPTPAPKGISATDFVKLFKANDDSPIGMRNRALLAFLADTGCRLQAASTLTVDDLDLDNCQATAVEKGGHTRVLMYTSTTARLLFIWLRNRTGNGDSVFGLTSQGIYQVLKRLKEKTEVTGRVNPHAFRHSFARTYLMNGGDLASLSRLLGHKDIKTTAEHYAIFAKNELSGLHRKYSPLIKFLKHDEDDE